MLALRPFGGLILALVLALTSVTMAQARGQAMAVGQIVICSGGGIVSVPVDAEGRPTGPAHLCPDCALGLFAAAPAAFGVLVRSADWRPQAPLPVPGIAPAAPTKTPQSARGPPAPV
jgi:hypothetical protein